jgi:3-oxoadipate enol-lactonase
MLGAADEREAIAKYRGPTVVALGEHDQATPLAMANDLVSHISGSTLHVIRGAKHFTPIEAPEEVASCIRKVLKQVA